MKCQILDLIALWINADTVKQMVDGYIDSNNNEHYQYSVAGLIPSEYYRYITTGNYPVDNCYGVKATGLMPIGALVKARLSLADEKKRKVRATNAKKRENADKIRKSPTMIVARDQRILQREISKWTRFKKTAIGQVLHLNCLYL